MEKKKEEYMSLIEQFKEALNPNKKILNIFHKDLDGCVSSIVMKNVYKNIEYRDLRYGFVDEFLKKVNFDNYDTVVLTDISPETEDVFLLSDKIFLLDHHDSAIGYHNPRKNRVVMTGKSAALMVKEFYENLFGIDLSYLNELCNAANDYDMWINKDPRGWSLNQLYFKMWDEAFRKRFKNGDIKFTDVEEEYLKMSRQDLDEKYRSTITYDLDGCKGCYIFQSSYINEICHKIMEDKGYKIIVCYNIRTSNCSVRSINPDLHVGNMLKELGYGGGHPQAGGFFSTQSDLQGKLEKIETYCSKIESMR